MHKAISIFCKIIGVVVFTLTMIFLLAYLTDESSKPTVKTSFNGVSFKLSFHDCLDIAVPSELTNYQQKINDREMQLYSFQSKDDNSSFTQILIPELKENELLSDSDKVNELQSLVRKMEVELKEKFYGRRQVNIDGHVAIETTSKFKIGDTIFRRVIIACEVGGYPFVLISAEPASNIARNPLDNADQIIRACR